MPNSNETPQGSTVMDAVQAMAGLKDISDEFLEQIPTTEGGEGEAGKEETPPAPAAQETPPKKEGESSATEEGKEPPPPAEKKEEETPPAEKKDEPPPPPQPKPTDEYRVLNADGTEETVTREEAMRRGLRQADYTRKTQDVAEQRKLAAQERAEIAERGRKYVEGLEKVKGALQALTTEPDWNDLRSRVTPEEFTRQHAAWQSRKARLDALEAEAESTSKTLLEERVRQREAHITDEARKFATAVPDFVAEGEKGIAFREGMYKAAEAIGFDRQMVDDTVDHRLLILLDKARQLDAIKAAAAPKPKPATPPSAGKPQPKPKVAAPGAATAQPAAQSTKDKQREAAAQRLGESGSVEDAASLIGTLDDLSL